MDGLSADLILEACPRPCQRITVTEVILHEDGSEELVRGEPPLPRCSACPHADEERPPVRYIEIVRNYPPDVFLPRAVNDPTPPERCEDPASWPPAANGPGDEPEPDDGTVPPNDPEPVVPEDDLPIPAAWRNNPHHPHNPNRAPERPPGGGVPFRPARNPWRDGGGYGYPSGDPDHWSF